MCMTDIAEKSSKFQSYCPPSHSWTTQDAIKWFCLSFVHKVMHKHRRHTCSYVERDVHTGWSTGSFKYVQRLSVTEQAFEQTHTEKHSQTHIPLESAYWDNETMITAAYGSLSATSQRSLCVQSIHSLFSVIRVVIISRCVPLLRTLAVLYLLTRPPQRGLIQSGHHWEWSQLCCPSKNTNSPGQWWKFISLLKKFLHNLRGSSWRQCNANVCSFHPEGAQRFCGDGGCSSVNCEPTQWIPILVGANISNYFSYNLLYISTSISIFYSIPPLTPALELTLRCFLLF